MTILRDMCGGGRQVATEAAQISQIAYSPPN